MRQKGEKWSTRDGRIVIITFDLANSFVRVLNQSGKLEVIHENLLENLLNKDDFPSRK